VAARQKRHQLNRWKPLTNAHQPARRLEGL
jgi:hypothetical protein